MSRLLYEHIDVEAFDEKPTSFEEIVGKGIEATVNKMKLKLGSISFVGETVSVKNETAIHIKIDDVFKGSFIFKNSYREGTKQVFEYLSKNYKLVILSGDNDGEKKFLEKLLPHNTKYAFDQNPESKLKYIKALQEKGDLIMMVGDGLNDAGALAQSDVGIAISENVNVFSPACDAILDAKLFKNLPNFLILATQTLDIIKVSFMLSFFYNIIGMYFALTGKLTPVIAAILMPLSSITIVIFVTILTNLISKKIKLT